MARRKKLTLHERLKAALIASPFTYTSLGKKIGTPKTNVFRQLNGERALSIAELRQLVDLLGVEVDGLELLEHGASMLGVDVSVQRAG